MGGRAPPGKDDGRSQKARAPRATWAHVAVGGALCSWPITSAEAPHPLPPLIPDAPLQPPFPSKYFQGNQPKMEASSSHAPILRACALASTPVRGSAGQQGNGPVLKVRVYPCAQSTLSPTCKDVPISRVTQGKVVRAAVWWDHACRPQNSFPSFLQKERGGRCSEISP